ncbi:DUF4244 domain-containing protein [Cellulomonas olei]|uniref:DUF4244 domain-containing protein n=1 Tax=Cellulomonas sp. P4 TaxID=3142533 RepID=UPI0031BA2148
MVQSGRGPGSGAEGPAGVTGGPQQVAVAGGRWARGQGASAAGQGRRVARVLARLRPDGRPGDAGMATAEYAVVMIAAVGFAGLLVLILSSAEVREALLGLVRDALSV